tara:strand:- start:15872 stop:16798 length:927 start_codon:yes stop_codon:yes gene_type:complete
MMRFDLSNYLRLSESGVFIASIIFIGYGAAIVLLNYLRGNRFESKDSGYLMDELRVLRNEIVHGNYLKKDMRKFELKIKELEELLKSGKKDGGPLSEDERDIIICEIKNNILSEASSSVLKEIEEKYSSEFRTQSQVSGLQEQLENTRLRLRLELEALGRRGNVNLVIGVLTTVAAVGILTTTILDPNVKLTNDTLVTHFAPRLMLSLFIEIFSFFFLKLYKSGLGEIKYFQNELTNIELKFLSLESALRSENEELVAGVVGEFSRTERNFILGRGQSTVEIERNRLGAEAGNNVISSFSKLVESIKK